MNQIHFDTSEICYQLGIRDAVFSPGSRNAPLSISFSRHPHLRTRVVVDERSAGFIALGIAQHTQRPVVLCCTSGTALLNYGPAIAEAYYSRTPLIIMSGDRPSEWIDQWDGQTIKQQNVFQAFVKAFIQMPTSLDFEDARWAYQTKIAQGFHLATQSRRPVHLNFPFREPFYPDKNQKLAISQDLKIIKSYPAKKQANCEGLIHDWAKATKKIIVIGQGTLSEDCKNQLRRLASQGIPIIADIISNGHALTDVIQHQDLFLNNSALQESLTPDLVLTFGRSIISKNLKLFLRKSAAIQWHIDPQPELQDPYQRLLGVIEGNPEQVLNKLIDPGQPSQVFANHWQVAQRQTAKLLIQYQAPFSEFSAMQEVLKKVPRDIQIHLSNSMPVRYANFLGIAPSKTRVWANRGTSGIDGSNGTAVGHALSSDQLSLLLTGDLSFLYDRNAFFHNEDLSHMRIVVFNNFGGGIFDLIPGPEALDPAEKDKFLTTPHQKDLSHSALDLGFDYQKCIDSSELNAILIHFFEPSAKGKLLEIQTQHPINKQVFQALKKIIYDYPFI